MEWTVEGGGQVATALASLSRLGVSCKFFGITGDDEAGSKIVESLIEENIDIRGLLKRPQSDSQVAFISVEQGTGKRTIFWKRPSAGPLMPDELPDDFLDGSDFLLLDGLMTEASLFAAQRAREMGIPVILDAGRMRSGMIKLASKCDYVVASEEFAKEYTVDSASFSPEKVLVQMKPFGAKAATVTLGSRGSVTDCGDEVFHVPAFKVNAVDTTGAGDVFHGGYIYGLLQNWDIKRVVRFASAFAALKCRKLGGRAGIPGLEEVEAFIAGAL
jgi:ribokinase